MFRLFSLFLYFGTLFSFLGSFILTLKGWAGGRWEGGGIDLCPEREFLVGFSLARLVSCPAGTVEYGVLNFSTYTRYILWSVISLYFPKLCCSLATTQGG